MNSWRRIWRLIRPLRFAVAAFLIPPLLFALFIFGGFIGIDSEMLFWVLFLLSLLPLGFVGTVITVFVTFWYWSKLTTNAKVFHAFVLLYGLASMIGGVMALLLLYVVLAA